MPMVSQEKLILKKKWKKEVASYKYFDMQFQTTEKQQRNLQKEKGSGATGVMSMGYFGVS